MPKIRSVYLKDDVNCLMCNYCQKILPFTDFKYDTRYTHHRQSTCKECDVNLTTHRIRNHRNNKKY